MIDILARGMVQNLREETKNITQSTLTPPNKKYKMVAGTIRNTGSGWHFINDTAHEPINVTTVTNNTSAIEINYSFQAKKIISFIITPDETFAKEGLFCGASVGTTKAVITCSYGDGTAANPNNLTTPASNLWFMGLMEVE